MRSFLFGGLIAFGIALNRLFPTIFYYEFQYSYWIEVIFIVFLFFSMVTIKRLSIWLTGVLLFHPAAHLWMPIHVALATIFMVLLGYTLPFLSLSFYSAAFWGLYSLALFILNDMVSREMHEKESRKMYGDNDHIGGDLRRGY